MLAERASEEGIERFTATALASNRVAIDLLGDLGPAEVRPADGGLVEVRIELSTETAPGTPLRRALRSVAAGLVEVRARLGER